MSDWLTRTEHGWTEPLPPRCGCGEVRHMVGWHTCLCGGGPLSGGHRTWECRGCGRMTMVGCVEVASGA